MTFEKKCFVEPEDILAVRFECSNCGSILTIPVKQISSTKIQKILDNPCSQCDKETGFPFGTSEMERFIRFNVTLSELSEAMKGRNLKFGFEVKCDE